MTEDEAFLSDGGEELIHEQGRNDRVDALADRAVVREWADGIPR